jgi:hypothetical protein
MGSDTLATRHKVYDRGSVTALHTQALESYGDGERVAI